MDLSQQQAERLNRGIDIFLQRLNASLGVGYSPQDLPYRICKMEDHKIAFGISHRAPVGQRHPNGQKWITHPGPWADDCELIAQTSRTPEEVATQFHRCVFEGVRPMHTKSGQLMDEAAINAIVAQKVNEKLRELLDAKIAELQSGKLAPTAALAVQRVEAGEVAEAKAWQDYKVAVDPTTPSITEVPLEPRLPTQAPHPEPHDPEIVLNPKLLRTWTERAAILGLAPPKMTKSGRIDGRWMRNAQDKWRARIATERAETPA